LAARFEPAKYRDTYREKLRANVGRKLVSEQERTAMST
jgi:non-homologous end joining protein Ku